MLFNLQWALVLVKGRQARPCFLVFRFTHTQKRTGSFKPTSYMNHCFYKYLFSPKPVTISKFISVNTRVGIKLTIWKYTNSHVSGFSADKDRTFYNPSSCRLNVSLQSKQVKRTPQDSIWFPYLLSNSNRHFCMRNEQWISHENFSVLGQIGNLSIDYIS